MDELNTKRLAGHGRPFFVWWSGNKFNDITMHSIKIKTKVRQILADTITPVSVYLRVRDVFPQSILLESSDYRTSEDSYSFRKR